MRIVICDDEPIFVEQLKKYIIEYFNRQNLKIPEISNFYNGEALLLDQGLKDIVFLDIEMPGMNGIYIGNELKQINPNTLIFIVTSYMEYLDEAMRFHVFRYLSKPIDKHRLFRNLKEALQIYSSSTIKVPIETKSGVYSILASDIINIEACGRKVTIHTTTKDYESIHTMQYWIDTLPRNCFFQSHRSFIINFKHVTDFDKTLIHLFNSQFTAYLTRRKYSSFKDAYLLYLESMR